MILKVLICTSIKKRILTSFFQTPMFHKLYSIPTHNNLDLQCKRVIRLCIQTKAVVELGGSSNDFRGRTRKVNS